MNGFFLTISVSAVSSLPGEAIRKPYLRLCRRYWENHDWYRNCFGK